MAATAKTKARRKSKDPVRFYAEEVLAGGIIAGPYVRLACERHLEDLTEGKRRGLRYDNDLAHVAFDFWSMLSLPEGGPFALLAWQQFIVGSLLAWLGPDGFRRFRVGYIEASKGSGKSPLIGGIALFGLFVDDEQLPEIYAAATKMDQAKICWQDAVNICEHSEALEGRYQAFKRSLYVPENGGWFKPMSADKNQSGPRVHMGLVDEYHEHKTDTVVSMIRAGFKNRRQPLIVKITNTPQHERTPCGAYRDSAIKILKKVYSNDQVFAYICAMDLNPWKCEYNNAFALRYMIKACTCELPIATQISLIREEGCAQVVTTKCTEASGGHRNATQSGKKKRGACVNRVTSESNLKIQSEGRRHTKALRDGLGRHQSEQSIFASGMQPGQDTDQKWPDLSDSENLESIRRSLRSCGLMDAEYAEIGNAFCASITTTVQERREASCARRATAHSAISAILLRLYSGHSPTCKTRLSNLNGSTLTVEHPSDDWKDESVWEKANPSLGTVVTSKYLRERVRESEGLLDQESEVKRLNFCIMPGGSKRSIDLNQWDKNNPTLLKSPEQRRAEYLAWAESLRGRECFGGLDLGKVSDLSAYNLFFPPTDEHPRPAWLAWYWCPEEDIVARSRSGVPYDVWHRLGWIKATEGNTTDFDFVEADILALHGLYNITRTAFDRTFAGEIVQHLIAEGCDMLDFGQGYVSMTTPTEYLLRYVKGNLLDHGSHPITRWCAENLVCAKDPAGNLKPDKERSPEKIDGMSSGIMSIGAWLDKRPKRSSDPGGAEVW